MLQITLVSYLNTKPFMDGIRHEFSEQEVSITLVPPAECARAMETDTCDLALVPTGALEDLDTQTKPEMLGDYCLGADGKVDSVFLFSKVPLEEIETVRLDPHSRTSNGLIRILMTHWWKGKAEFEMPQVRDFEPIEGNCAGVAIGDAAYRIREQFPFVWDLSEEWKKWTGLPFVFAVWVYFPSKVPTKTRERLHKAFAYGMDHLPESAAKWASEFGYTVPEAVRYLQNSMSFDFNQEKHKAFEKYLKLLREMPKTIQV